MKYIEELNAGDCFQYQNQKFILTSDTRRSKDRYQAQAISLDNGFPRWMDTDVAVEKLELYIIDNDKNIIPIKEYKDEFIEENKNVH